MIQVNDFLLDSTGDLALTANGDFATGFSDPTHLEHILEAYTGWYREAILLGVGIQDYLNSGDAGPEIKRKVQIQLEADNYKISFITITGALELAFDAERIR